MKITILVFLFLISLITKGQVSIDTTLYYETANVGTVKKVTNEEVCAIVFFVSNLESNWEKKNKKKIIQRDAKAFKKLKKELKNYDVQFKIHFEYFHLDKDFKIDSIVNYKKQPLKKNHYDISNKYKENNVRKIWDNYTNSDIAFFKDKKYESYEGGFFLIIYHEGLGISSASPAILNGYKKRDLPEHITIFEFDQNWKKTNKNVTTHETLHLFGAWDLYNVSIYGFEDDKYQIIKENYPKSIMRSSKVSTVEDFTAWRIGLNSNPNNWFLKMVPEIYHKEYHQNLELTKEKN
jgi:hypothetical protein